MKILPKNRRGYFYSLDAFIALLIILGVVLFIKPPTSQVTYESSVHYDLLEVLSTLKIGEINNSYAKQWISDGNITELNKSVLDQLGEFYADSDLKYQTLSQDILSDLSLKENVGIYFDNNEIAFDAIVPIGNATDILTSRQIISGIRAGEGAVGFSSRAFLFAENKVDYFYFGGYVGDGNISVRIDGDVITSNIEGAFSGDFNLSINGNNIGSYSPTPDIPFNISLRPYVGYFGSGSNIITFNSTDNLYIAGGFIKITYNETQELANTSQKYFPGIDGLINIYDSFYVPGQLDSMEIFLHYNSSYDIFMTIGNDQVYSDNSGGSDLSVTFNNTYLSGILDYASLSNETIPYRLGLENVSYVTNYSQDADVFSVTDLSGSMRADCSGASFFCCWWGAGSSDNCNSQATCETCGGTWEDKIGEAKAANKVFIDAILNSTNVTGDNRLGLVGYETDVDTNDCHDLSNDTSSLKAEVDSWSANGATCICCGINEAVSRLLAQSSADKYRSIVVMSDGIANYECTPHRYDTTQAPLDAIQAACDAYNNYNITVHAIGFGSDADRTTLEDIASCGQGGFHFANVSELVDVYQEVAQDIITAAYQEQTIVAQGVFTKLYPDSYIKIDYTRTTPSGMLIVSETSDFGNNISQGSFYVPSDSEVYEVQAISYSGAKWTSLVEINNTGAWNTVFNLSEYNSDYIDLGDPYAVNIPPQMVSYGDNDVRIQVGLNPSDVQGGSEYNKIIYSLTKNISSWSPIVSSAEGCSWHIEFEDGSEISIKAPENYTGMDNCYYNSSTSPSPEPHGSFRDNDAVEHAVYLLLANLDLDDDGRIETKFTEQDLSIRNYQYEGIPFTWDTEVQARVWV